ncbi:hypothetical protein JTE90_003816 [Oedothorax gibbosus]|uniref:Uncharacterized protein n=1 Tax=Oedothorax gibbosus TaxID=931172 RepID=A0AAV6VJ75_9ARAC|nr:hypothetical protein JTE90_003816 [Oedothorax gibbosus]
MVRLCSLTIYGHENAEVVRVEAFGIIHEHAEETLESRGPWQKRLLAASSVVWMVRTRRQTDELLRACFCCRMLGIKCIRQMRKDHRMKMMHTGRELY